MCPKKIWLFVGVDHAAITVTYLMEKKKKDGNIGVKKKKKKRRVGLDFDSAETAVIIKTLVLHSSKKVSSSLLLCLEIRTNVCGSDE